VTMAKDWRRRLLNYDPIGSESASVACENAPDILVETCE